MLVLDSSIESGFTCLLSCSVFISQSKNPAFCAESLAKTLLGMNSPDNILLEMQHQFPPEPPQTAGPHLRGPRRGPPPSCSVLWLSAPTVRPLCSVQPVASHPPCRWSSALGAPGPGPRASAPRLHLPVLTSSPPRQVLCRPGADPSPSPGPFVSHPPCVRGPAPTAFLLACKHGLFSSVKHKPTRS